MIDWSPPLGEAQRSLKAVDQILTNFAPGQALDAATQDEVIGHLQVALVAIDQCAAWVRAH